MGPEPGCLKAVLTLPPPGFGTLSRFLTQSVFQFPLLQNEDDIVATSRDPCEDKMRLILESIKDAAQFLVGVGKAASVEYGYY